MLTKNNYKTVKDCYYCPYIINCKDRVQAKIPIDALARQEKQKVIKFNLMPPYKNQSIDILFSGIIHRTKKTRKRFLKHLHHCYDVDVAIKVWNNPSLLRHISEDTLGETKNKNADRLYRIRGRKSTASFTGMRRARSKG